jgi:hypothetical protein
MNTANEHSDECPASLAAYSDSIAEIDLIVASLTSAANVGRSRASATVRSGSERHVFYPIFPPNTHSERVLDWLRENPA